MLVIFLVILFNKLCLCFVDLHNYLIMYELSIFKRCFRPDS